MAKFCGLLLPEDRLLLSFGVSEVRDSNANQEGMEARPSKDHTKRTNKWGLLLLDLWDEKSSGFKWKSWGG